MKIQAPGKINVTLRVHAKRTDGYHAIETLMVPISLFDGVEVGVLGEGVERIECVCDDSRIPCDIHNLAVIAAKEFFAYTQRPYHVRITLWKVIPMQAGLGGGSSDAATVLLLLNRLCGANLTEHELAQIAARVGSDVAFFIHRRPAVCRGRGEKIEQMVPVPRWPLVLVKPPFGVETAGAYKRWENSCELEAILYTEQQWDDFAFVNHLERPVFEKYLFLPILKRWLLAQGGVRIALLSGSGSTMFAICDTEASAQVLRKSIIEEFGDLWVATCHTL